MDLTALNHLCIWEHRTDIKSRRITKLLGVTVLFSWTYRDGWGVASPHVKERVPLEHRQLGYHMWGLCSFHFVLMQIVIISCPHICWAWKRAWGVVSKALAWLGACCLLRHVGVWAKPTLVFFFCLVLSGVEGWLVMHCHSCFSRSRLMPWGGLRVTLGTYLNLFLLLFWNIVTTEWISDRNPFSRMSFELRILW